MKHEYVKDRFTIDDEHIENPEAFLIAHVIKTAMDDMRHFIKNGTISPDGEIDFSKAPIRGDRTPEYWIYIKLSELWLLVDFFNKDIEIWAEIAGLNYKAPEFRKMVGLNY